jgi:ornithine cyclodeaminase/alanine dehydrogenase-like protein (mu-crystallin family)
VITLSAENIAKLLPMDKAIEIVEAAMIGVAEGRANLPLRMAVDVGGNNKLGVMPGVLEMGEVYGVKLLSLFPGNPARGLSSHIGAMLLFDPKTGAPAALMNADALTAIRTAAASAAATRALARPEASVLSVIGTGEQAEAHITALSLVCGLKEIRVVGRSLAKAQALIDRLDPITGKPLLIASDNAQEAATGADIICTVTSSHDVVLRGDWVAPGTHVNAVGASIPLFQEIDEALVARAELFTDYRLSALAQAKDIIEAIKSGSITEDHILAEIGAVYSGAHTGRSGPEAVTLYRSLGVAAQDLACAQFVADTARQQGIGVKISL